MTKACERVVNDMAECIRLLTNKDASGCQYCPAREGCTGQWWTCKDTLLAWAKEETGNA